MNIGIIIGSTRPGRAGAAVGQWVFQQAQPRRGARYELVDLADYALDLLNEPVVPGAANRKYENPKTLRWSRKVDELDGFVFVTPEYNHGVPAAFKNAFDVIYPEWNHKAVGLVGYGADGAVRAVESWRLIVANAHLHAVRAQLSLSLYGDFGDKGFSPTKRRVEELATLLDQLERLASVVATMR